MPNPLSGSRQEDLSQEAVPKGIVTLAAVREELGEEAFAAALAEGRARSVEELLSTLWEERE